MLIVQFIMPNLLNTRSFKRIRCNFIKIWHPNLTRKCMPGATRDPWHTFLPKKNLASYFYDFVADSNQTSYTY